MNTSQTIDELQQKSAQLKEFVQYKTCKCDQRSQQWHDMRRKSFGGSEIASLMGQCESQYINQKKFMREKAQKALKSYQQNINKDQQLLMDWGTFFEPVHRHIMEQLFKAEIVEASMSQGQNMLKGCHQSPDGIAVIETKQLLKYVSISPQWHDRSIFDQQYLTVLFEQKSPARRVPDGNVPKYYIGQVKLGLSLFDPCDVGCYTESVFLVCNMDQLFNKQYNKKIIKKRYNKDEKQHREPKYIGFIEFDDQFINEILKIEDSRTWANKMKGDISQLIDEQSFAILASLVKDGKFNAKYHCIEYQNTMDLLKFVREKTQKMRAFMCWKLVDINFTAIEKSDGFGILTSMFVNLGQRALTECVNDNTIKDSSFSLLKQFGNLTVNLNIPLTPQNIQDQWFCDNKDKLVSFFEDNFDDTWDSLYILLGSMLFKATSSNIQYTCQQLENCFLCCRNDSQKQQEFVRFLELFQNQVPDELQKWYMLLLQTNQKNKQNNHEIDQQQQQTDDKQSSSSDDFLTCKSIIDDPQVSNILTAQI